MIVRVAPLVRRLLLLTLLGSSLSVHAARADRDPVIAAAGDIACSPRNAPTPTQCQQAATAALIGAIDPDAVLALGDEQYPCGTAADFAAYDQSWGAFKAITHPVPGNHEYNVGAAGERPQASEASGCADLPSPSDAAGYFGYFGASATPRHPHCAKGCGGYYSFDLGAWHVIALNSNCDAVGCAEGSQQEQWLEADLAANPSECTLAFWHHPPFTSGRSGSDARMAAIWSELASAGVDLALAGHDHHYERFVPLDADGEPAKVGLAEMVVGTGGDDLEPFAASPQVGSQVRIANRFGVLKLTLHAKSYDWAFLPIDGSDPLDAGHADCH